MANKKSNDTDVEERTVKVKAKVNLKYDSDVVKTGEDILIKQSDMDSMKPYVDVIDMPKDATSGANSGQQAPQNTQPPAK